MPTLQELASYKPKNNYSYGGTTQYQGQEVAPWNCPAALANDILGEVKHTIAGGAQIIAPMGHGKTKLCQCVIHHIHTQAPEFKVHWAGVNEFINLQRFLESLPKYQPSIIVFDDITSALKQMNEKDRDHNFNVLTRVREILDPEKKKTRVIIFVISHYSKNLEKEFRNVLGRTIFLSFGNEERANMDSIAPKKSPARAQLRRYIRIYSKLFSAEKFSLRTGNGREIEYILDKPFRPACAISSTDGKIIVYDELDCCNECAKKNVTNFVNPERVYDNIINAYGSHGNQALKHWLAKNGYYKALPRQLAAALDFLDSKVFPNISTDLNQLVEIVWKKSKKRPPKQIYHKRGRENEALKDMFENADQKELINNWDNISNG